MNSNILSDNAEIKLYNLVNLTVKQFIEVIEEIIENNSVAGGYMTRHSKFKGISYNSDDEYVDQFIELYEPPKKNTNKKNNKKETPVNAESKDETKEESESSEEVAEEDIHEFSFDTKYRIDECNRIFYICDPGTGNRINLNSILSALNKVIMDNNGLHDCSVKYGNDKIFLNINEMHVNSAKKSIKFY
jgi:hypothetical protein